MLNLISGIIILGIIILIYHFYFRKDARPQSENNAGRFARLLIAEIKLYNNYKIQRGLKNNNLYESLKDEIEEARNKYRKGFLKRTLMFILITL